MGTTRSRLRIQIKAIKLAIKHLCDQNSADTQLIRTLGAEMDQLKYEYRYLTYEERCGSLAAEMVVGWRGNTGCA